MTEYVKIILWHSNIADQRNLGNVDLYPDILTFYNAGIFFNRAMEFL